MRALPTLVFVLTSVFALVPPWTGDARGPVLGDRPDMTADRVALDPDDPGRTRLDGLTYLGGVVLRSRDPAFGGYSSMTVAGAGDRFTLLSDGGNIVRFRMGADWRPGDIAFASLPSGPGTGWSKRDRDSESMTVDPVTGAMWIGFERSNAIWRYTAAFRRATGQVQPAALAGWPANGGPESMVRMRDGRLVVMAETARPPRIAGVRQPGRQALIFSGDPVDRRTPAARFVYLPPAGYDPADVTQLPDGRLLVLNRAFVAPFAFSNSLVLLDPAAIRAGAAIRGREIARLAAPLTHDNFEGVAAVRSGRDTIVWIVSDDNETMVQRTLLLKFRLDR